MSWPAWSPTWPPRQRYLRHAIVVVATPPVSEPVSIADVKLRAGLDWADGDPRDALTTQFIQTAREYVEQDTGLSLLTQTRDAFFDQVPWPMTPMPLPMGCTPAQSVVWFQVTSSEGAVTTIDPSQYQLDTASNPARFMVADNCAWPTDVRRLQPWNLRVLAGWTTPAEIPARLVHAVGLLAAHLLTTGRDLVSTGRGIKDEPMPWGYEDAIAAWKPVSIP